MSYKFLRALLTIAFVAMASPPPSAGVEVALFYAPNLALGGANGLSEAGPLGLKARVTLAEAGALRFNAAFGYGVYRYKDPDPYFPTLDRRGEIRASNISFGADLGWRRGRWRPYGAFGFAAVWESMDAYTYHAERTVFMPGMYAGGGVSFALARGWAAALEPRYTYYFDRAAVVYNLERPGGDVPTEGRFQCVDVLIGMTYGF